MGTATISVLSCIVALLPLTTDKFMSNSCQKRNDILWYDVFPVLWYESCPRVPRVCTQVHAGGTVGFLYQIAEFFVFSFSLSEIDRAGMFALLYRFSSSTTIGDHAVNTSGTIPEEVDFGTL